MTQSLLKRLQSAEDFDTELDAAVWAHFHGSGVYPQEYTTPGSDERFQLMTGLIGKDGKRSQSREGRDD